MGSVEKKQGTAEEPAEEAEGRFGFSEDDKLRQLIENSCLGCRKLMDSNEVKILPPRYVQERDIYVSKGMVRRRLICLSCYNRLMPKVRLGGPAGIMAEQNQNTG